MTTYPLSRRRVLGVAALAALARPALVQPALAQSWPSRPIRYIVTFPPGGSGDALARVLAPVVGERLGQPIVVENRPGAGGNIGMDAVAKAAPDGYTLGQGPAGALTVNPSLYPALPFDPLRDFAPVTMLGGTPFLLAVRARSELHGLGDLLTAARARPDRLTVAHGGVGSAMHLTAELLNQAGQIRLITVPYRGVGPSLTALLSGDTDLAVLDPPAALPLIADGQIRALAVSSPQRMPQLPDVPTVAEAGLGGFESLGWLGLVAPAATPAPILARLHEVFTGALRDPAVLERLNTIGVTAQPTTSAEFAAIIRSETEKWGKVVRAAGIRVE
ncbi:tripartite tricarboxylate transporter substrate binding protein [Roseomonas sp. OT10]|uniref:Bug family tripartite tricarboxylate transporter substrate binding protein n=1 Tax=Roseomonas cutis TaxID=2897332 RepID=UPI001E3E4B9B|nr:tripartite tricarboxylate transporter substrate binding protein [Roseomonas sp. OT10]UFN49480.1 tripartite tricarboxylate transporter substrate binding protein [Roseomonas sp. OT10]